MVTHRTSVDGTWPLPAARCDCGWRIHLSTHRAAAEACEAHLHDADPWTPVVCTITVGGAVWEHEG